MMIRRDRCDMEGKHHCWPGIFFCEQPTTHRFCFNQRTAVPIFLGQKIRIKEPSVPVISTTSKNPWVSWKNQQGYKSGSLIFFPFSRTMVIYPNLCNHSSRSWKNQVTTFISAGSLLVPIDSNPHCYVWNGT